MENALVVRQSPDPGPDGDRLISVGEPVDIFLRENPESQALRILMDTNTTQTLPQLPATPPQNNN